MGVFEGLCFETSGGKFDSLTKCKDGCKEVIKETKEDERDKELNEVISDKQKEKDKIEQIENPLTPDEIKKTLMGSGLGKGGEGGGICPTGTYFCKTINECIPNQISCPEGVKKY